MASLTIRLLGVPEVYLGERPLSFRTRKVLALLVYLVVDVHYRELHDDSAFRAIAERVGLLSVLDRR